MKLTKFWKIYLIACAAFIGVLGIILIIFWNALADYENTRPSLLAQSMAEEISAGKYDSFCDNLNIVKADFISEGEVKKRLKEITGKKDISFSKAFSANRAENPAFYLLSGKKEIAKLTLKNTGKKSFFGQPLYKIKHISEFYNTEKPVTVTVPEEYQVSVNGKKLSGEWISSTQASAAETGFALNKKSKKPRLKTYKIDGSLSGENISVVNADGEALGDAVLKDGAIDVDYKTLTLIAAKGIKPVVNGIEIGGQWALDEAGTDEMTDRIPEKYFTKRPEFVKYKVTGLADTPEISAADTQGKKVTVTISEASGKYTAQIYYAAENPEEYKKIAIEFARIYAKTVSNDFGKSAFLAKILPDAPIRKELGTSLRPEFYSNHAGNYFEDETVSDPIIYSENAFVCDVKLTHCITGVKTSPGKALKFTTKMRMCFIKQENTWYLGEWMLQS